LKRTLLRWAGSKKKLLPSLTKYYSGAFERYLEPFVGSGQLFFNLPVKIAILSDINHQLIKTYNTIKTHHIEVFEYLSNFQKGKEQYYKLRDNSLPGDDEALEAAKFIYLNTYCFNGLYRTNLSGKFNVPYSESSGKIIDLETLESIANHLQKASFIHGDFEEIVTHNCRKNDFIYLDPPYAIKNKRIFSQYGPDTFGLDDLNRLKKLIEYIDQREAKFVLSYALCDEALFLCDGWDRELVSTVRNISGFAKHRKLETEVLITNISL